MGNSDDKLYVKIENTIFAPGISIESADGPLLDDDGDSLLGSFDEISE